MAVVAFQLVFLAFMVMFNFHGIRSQAHPFEWGEVLILLITTGIGVGLAFAIHITVLGVRGK
jgi:hypothetical protein